MQFDLWSSRISATVGTIDKAFGSNRLYRNFGSTTYLVSSGNIYNLDGGGMNI